MKLRKVVRDCKEAYTQGTNGSHMEKEKPRASKPMVSPTGSVLGDLSNGNFADALRKAVAKEEDDADVDFNLDGVDQLSGVDFGITAMSPGNPATAVDLAMLRQPLHLAFLQYGKQTVVAAPPAIMPSQLHLPANHSTISRVVVNAIGRLGRWKRVLNYRATGVRAPVRPPLGLGGAACVDATTFDLEASETGDLLLIKGGVEQYLKTIESQMGTRRSASMYRLPRVLDASSQYNAAAGHLSTASDTTMIESEALEPVREASDEGASTEDEPTRPPESAIPPELASAPEPIPPATPVVLAAQSPTTASLRSSVMSDDSLEFANPQPWRSRYQMDVVSIDDLDLSDLSSAEAEPDDIETPPTNGLRRLNRKLPNRRDFEFVRQSVASVSSMGIRTHDSVLSAGSSVVSSAHVSGSADFAGPIQQWQVNALVDSLSDDEEVGDVEDALRRLEGQISDDRRRAKQTKVDGWVQTIRERLANGQFGPERPRYSSDEEDYGEIQNSILMGNENDSQSTSSQHRASRASVSQTSARNSVRSSHSQFAYGNPDEAKAPPVPPGLGHPAPPVDGKPAPEDAVPIEILQSRVPSRPTTSAGSSPSEKLTSHLSMPNPASFVKPEKYLKRHRSFILSYKSETLVQHFSMIDRDLFLNLKFEELVSQNNWIASSGEYNILDWAQFQKERTKLKSEEPNAPKVSALTAVRSRFNVIANFVIAEIVITHPSERLMIHSKFVRIAWVSGIILSH
jgi:Gdp/GTP exchange factor required for growth at low temperatures